MQRRLFLCLLGLAGGLLLAGCSLTVYEKEIAVMPPSTDEAPLATLATVPGEGSWMQFVDLNHIVDSIVELFKHTATKEAIRNGVHYTERKRFLHVEFGGSREHSQGNGRQASDSP